MHVMYWKNCIGVLVCFIRSADRCISSDSLAALYRPACAALADVIFLLHFFRSRSPFCRATKFPSAISFNMALSRLRSATSFLSLVFSFPILDTSLRHGRSFRYISYTTGKTALALRFDGLLSLRSFPSRTILLSFAASRWSVPLCD